MKILIKNLNIVSSKEVFKGDILIEDDRFIKVGNFNYEKVVDEIIDREGYYAFPGFIDFHVHLDDQIGEFQIADNYQVGTQKALKNGITTLMTFVTQSKTTSLKDSLQIALNKTTDNLYCDVGYHLTPITFSDNDYSDIQDLIKQGYRTFKFYTTYKNAGIYADYKAIENFIKHFIEEDIKILVHCEDDEILQSAIKKSNKDEGFIYHSKSRPQQAEVFAVKRMIDISKKYKFPIHIVHVTLAESVKLLEIAKHECPITYETGMQYLYFDESVYFQENANYYFCTPPFRSGENVIEMNKLVLSDNFDIFATDHCPFTIQDKDKYKQNQDLIPNGLPGLEFLPQLAFNLFEEKSDNNLSMLCKKLSENPAKLIDQFPDKGIIKDGAFADLVLCKFGENKNLKGDKRLFNIYQNYQTDLEISEVFFKGKRVVENNNLVDNLAYGKVINLEK